ncbi:MAG TPA: TIGR02391 family protein [Gemmatimonadales bacterium]
MAPDPRQRRIAVNLTVLPKLAVPIAVRRAGLPGNATITTMDRDWMRERLEKFRAVCEECAHSNQDGYGGDPRVRARMHRLEPTARAVLKALDPDLASFNLDTMAGEHEGITAADRGLGMLADLDDVATRLRPEAPTLPADQLHPWVWDAARTFWDAGAHAVAVEQAAKSITAHTQQKTGYQLADDDLMSQVWSDEPPKADRPRLRFPGNRNAKTWQSRQRGARSLAQGCYGGIRNVVAHENAPDWPQQLALEYLACLSVLARWINEAEVQRAA